MLVDQVTAKICIPKIVFNICDARKMKSDEFFQYPTVCFSTVKNDLLKMPFLSTIFVFLKGHQIDAPPYLQLRWGLKTLQVVVNYSKSKF